jgi:D-alanyl-D-alanine dipeptidase
MRGLLVLLALSSVAEAKRFRIPKPTKQLILVVTESWTAPRGTLTRWERGEKGPWKKVGEPVDVVVGRSGLGWGLGLHADEIGMDRPGPLKSEKDGRAPAGAFKLGDATGYATAPPAGTTVAYKQATAKLVCVDDPKSKLYNQVVEETPGATEKAWKSAEQMLRSDAQYTWTVAVQHNMKPIVAGQGSCIFLHEWGGPAAPTEGCTAMPRADIEALLVWLKPDQQPLLVQLPKKEFDSLADDWKLPKE